MTITFQLEPSPYTRCEACSGSGFGVTERGMFRCRPCLALGVEPRGPGSYPEPDPTALSPHLGIHHVHPCPHCGKQWLCAVMHVHMGAKDMHACPVCDPEGSLMRKTDQVALKARPKRVRNMPVSFTFKAFEDKRLADLNRRRK